MYEDAATADSPMKASPAPLLPSTFQLCGFQKQKSYLHRTQSCYAFQQISAEEEHSLSTDTISFPLLFFLSS